MAINSTPTLTQYASITHPLLIYINIYMIISPKSLLISTAEIPARVKSAGHDTNSIVEHKDAKTRQLQLVQNLLVDWLTHHGGGAEVGVIVARRVVTRIGRVPAGNSSSSGRRSQENEKQKNSKYKGKCRGNQSTP